MPQKELQRQNNDTENPADQFVTEILIHKCQSYRSLEARVKSFVYLYPLYFPWLTSKKYLMRKRLKNVEWSHEKQYSLRMTFMW